MKYVICADLSPTALVEGVLTKDSGTLAVVPIMWTKAIGEPISNGGILNGLDPSVLKPNGKPKSLRAAINAYPGTLGDISDAAGVSEPTIRKAARGEKIRESSRQALEVWRASL